MSNLNSVVGILPVGDHQTAVDWYARWIGRTPDVAPTDGVAEWQLADNAWLQVTTMAERPGSASIVVGVNDVDEQRRICSAAGIELGDIDDLGFIKLAEAVDPAGNTVTFVEEISQS